jgi:hypothetical protein
VSREATPHGLVAAERDEQQVERAQALQVAADTTDQGIAPIVRAHLTQGGVVANPGERRNTIAAPLPVSVSLS